MVKIYEDLAELNIPVFEQGNAPETLPDEYFTFSEDYSSDHLSADNTTKEILYEFTLRYYTKNAETLYSRMIEALQLLKSKGYITTGVGYRCETYHETWFGRQADIKKIEYV